MTERYLDLAQLGVIWRAALDAGDQSALRVIHVAIAPVAKDWIAKPHEQKAMALCVAAHDAMVARLDQVRS